MKEVSGIDIASLMNGWIKNGGHPVLRILSRQISADKSSTTFTLTQELCQNNPNVVIPNPKRDENNRICYDIPLLIKCENDSKIHAFIMNQNTFTLTITHLTPPKWIKLNWGHTGVYR